MVPSGGIHGKKHHAEVAWRLVFAQFNGGHERTTHGVAERDDCVDGAVVRDRQYCVGFHQVCGQNALRCPPSPGHVGDDPVPASGDIRELKRAIGIDRRSLTDTAGHADARQDLQGDLRRCDRDVGLRQFGVGRFGTRPGELNAPPDRGAALKADVKSRDVALRGVNRNRCRQRLIGRIMSTEHPRDTDYRQFAVWPSSLD